ncbi:ester cyclase [Mycobacterium sp.]|uniref:ester cyclase n=1 Tax=Mycobacterium sp. TaxID=1785 RepID=UPI002BAEC9D3|nr:ester cyclase [Mycobacterium sp.]HTY31095.1 ester cyclase [Mycobacterium sp.]
MSEINEARTHEVPMQIDRGFFEQFAERLFAVWNQHDTMDLADLVAEDVVWIDPIVVEPARGVEGVRQFMENSWRAMPDLHFDVIGPRCFADDAPVAMVPWKMTGTYLHRFDPPGFAPTGRRIYVDGVDVYTFREHKIAHYVAYYDVSLLMRQLGILPASGSREEKMFVAVQRLRTQLSNLRR